MLCAHQTRNVVTKPNIKTSWKLLRVDVGKSTLIDLIVRPYCEVKDMKVECALVLLRFKIRPFFLYY